MSLYCRLPEAPRVPPGLAPASPSDNVKARGAKERLGTPEPPFHDGWESSLARNFPVPAPGRRDPRCSAPPAQRALTSSLPPCPSSAIHTRLDFIYLSLFLSIFSRCGCRMAASPSAAGRAHLAGCGRDRGASLTPRRAEPTPVLTRFPFSPVQGWGMRSGECWGCSDRALPARGSAVVYPCRRRRAPRGRRLRPGRTSLPPSLRPPAPPRLSDSSRAPARPAGAQHTVPGPPSPAGSGRSRRPSPCPAASAAGGGGPGRGRPQAAATRSLQHRPGAAAPGPARRGSGAAEPLPNGKGAAARTRAGSCTLPTGNRDPRPGATTPHGADGRGQSGARTQTASRLSALGA